MLSRMIMWLAGVTVAALAFEGTARLEDWLRWGMAFDSPYHSQADLMQVDSLGAHGRPGARFQKWRMNALGMRGDEVDSVPRAGVARVITVGASETFGLYEADDQEWPRQLADSLGPSFEVLNAAFPGMSLPTVIQDVERRLVRFRPAFVVLYPTPAQYFYRTVPTAAAPTATPVPLAAPLNLWASMRASDRLREQAKGMLPSTIATWVRTAQTSSSRAADGGALFREVPVERKVAFERDLRRFVGAVRGIGAVPVLATHADAFGGDAGRRRDLLAMWEKQVPLASGAVLVNFEVAAAAIVQRVASDSAVVLAQVRAVVGSRESAFADYAHFTDRGSALAAHAVARSILLEAAQR